MREPPAHPPAPLWRRLLRGALLGWLTAGGVLWAGQTALLFPGVWRLDHSPDAVARLEAVGAQRGARPVHLPRADGGEVYVWHLPAQGERAVLYFHGNAEPVTAALPIAQLVNAQGFDFVSVVARGFPGAEGTPAQDDLVADAEVALAWVNDTLHIPPERVVLHGHSMGGGVAAQLAARSHPAGLVLDATYACLADLAAEKLLHLYPVRWLLRSTFDTYAAASSIDAPVFQVHSVADRLIPIEQSRRLREVFPALQDVELQGYSHSQLLLVEDRPARLAYLRFLSEVAPLRTSR